jgi:hypothetical protein
MPPPFRGIGAIRSAVRSCHCACFGRVPSHHAGAFYLVLSGMHQLHFELLELVQKYQASATHLLLFCTPRCHSMVANRDRLPCKQQAAHLSSAADQTPQQQILESGSWNASQQQQQQQGVLKRPRVNTSPEHSHEHAACSMHVSMCSTFGASTAAVPVVRASKEDNILAHEDSSV